MGQREMILNSYFTKRDKEKRGGTATPGKEQIVVAIVIQLEKMIEARNENRDYV